MHAVLVSEIFNARDIFLLFRKRVCESFAPDFEMQEIRTEVFLSFYIHIYKSFFLSKISARLNTLTMMIIITITNEGRREKYTTESFLIKVCCAVAAAKRCCPKFAVGEEIKNRSYYCKRKETPFSASKRGQIKEGLLFRNVEYTHTLAHTHDFFFVKAAIFPLVN